MPNAPTGLLVAGSATQLTLSWTDVATDETGYRVFISPSNAQPAVAAHELAAGIQTYTFPANETALYTTFYVWVSAYNANGNSAPAAGSGVAGVAPNAPTGVSINTSSPFSITTTWTDASDNEIGFEVFWSTDDTKPSAPNATVAAGTQSYKLTQVFGAQTYRFWVDAVNVIGRAGTKATAAAATTDLVWNELWMDDGFIHLAMADTYNLIADGDAATQLYAYQSELPGTMGTAAAINPYVVWNAADQNINVTKLHYFWAEARKPEGSLISLRTLEPGGAVTGLAAVPTNLDAAVTWFATAGAKNYQVYWGTGTFAQASYAGATTLTNAPVIGLNPGTSYNFWVRTAGIGIGGSGNGFPGTPSLVTASTTGTSLGANLAAGKTAAASSAVSPASNVTDGKYTTRWESIQHDPEWVYVDLGASYNVTHVKLVWEGAYSQSFQIQVCAATCDDANAPADSWPWVNAYAADRLLTGGFPNFELLAVTPTMGQFVRMRGLTRATAYGHSLYEVEVYSAP